MRLRCPEGQVLSSEGRNPPSPPRITGCARKQQTHKYKTTQCECPVWGMKDRPPPKRSNQIGVPASGPRGLAPGSQVERVAEARLGHGKKAEQSPEAGLLLACLFCFVLFHYVSFLSHCSKVLFSGWWIKEFLTLNKFRPTTGPAEREELGAGVGGWVAGMSEEGGDTRRTCKERPHLLWGCSVLQLSERQPTWAERLLVEYFNPCPCSLSPSQASRLSPKLTQLNIPNSKLGVSRGGNLPLALCPSSVLAPSSGVAAGSQAG